MWSKNFIPSISAACLSRWVTSWSWGLGVRSPDGWLCATTIEQARSTIASANTSRGCTWQALAMPMVTIRVEMTSWAPLSDMQINVSCLRSARCLTKGRTSWGSRIFVPSGSMRRLENSRAATSMLAFAEPIPGIVSRSSTVKVVLVLSRTLTTRLAKVKTSADLFPLPSSTASSSWSVRDGAPSEINFSRGFCRILASGRLFIYSFNR